MRFSASLRSLLALLLALLLTARSQAAQVYTVDILGDLGGAGSWSQALNDSGQAVGFAATSLLSANAFWYGGGALVDLGTLPGGGGSYALGISPSGAIAGWSGNFLSYRRAVLWAGPYSSPVDLGTLGGPASTAYDMNGAIVVGEADTLSGSSHAAAWSGVITDLGTLGGRQSAALGINGAGTIVGWAETSSGAAHAALWPGIGTGATDLDPAGWFSLSQAEDVSDTGFVTGWGVVATTGAVHGFLGSATGGLVDIGSPGGDTYGAAVNDAGSLVANTLLHPWLRSSAGAWLELNERIPMFSGITLLQAQDINDAGQITGWGPDDAGNVRGYVLTPVPSGLALSRPNPGYAGTTNSLGTVGGTPGATVYFVYGLAPGTATVPGCPGLTVEIASPVIAGSMVADGMERAWITAPVPGSASGRTVRIQAVEPSSCRKSNLVVYTFP